MGNPPSKGWYVEVEHNTTGHIWSPSILDDPEWRPQLNDLPEVRVPVTRNERWTDPAYEEAPMRLWKDGQRLPIDTLRTVTLEPGRAILVGEGGTELLDRISNEIDQKRAYLTAKDYVENNTTYATNFDNPDSTPEEEQFQSATTTSEFNDNLLDAIDSDEPVEVTGDEIQLQRSCFTHEGEDGSGTFSSVSDSNYSGGSGAGLSNSGDDITWTFIPKYDIPAENFKLRVRADRTGASDPELTWSLNGSDFLTSPSLTNALDWTLVSTDGAGGLSAGTTYDLRVRVSTANSDTTVIDVVAPYDNRYNYNFDSDNGGSSGFLDGPELYPDAHRVEFDDVTTFKAVVGARVDSTWDNTAGGSQAIYVSNDQGQTEKSSSNTADDSFSFSSAGSTLRFEADFSRYGSRTTATPQTGFNGQVLKDYTLFADVEDSPVIVDRVHEGPLRRVLQEIAEFSDSIFEVRYVNGSFQIDWTQPGQRTADSDEGLSDYRQSKTTKVYKKVVVFGSAQTISDERWTTNHGIAVDLEQDNLRTAREIVYDPNDGSQFEKGRDYTISYQSGQITALSSGRLSDSTKYAIDYKYEPKGSAQTSGFTSGDREYSTTIPAATTDRECGQAAAILLDEIEDPRWQSTVKLSDTDAGRSLVDDLRLVKLPTDERMEIRELRQSPDETTLVLRSREKIPEVVRDINQRLSAVSKRS